MPSAASDPSPHLNFVVDLSALLRHSRKIRSVILDYALGTAIVGLIPLTGWFVLELKLLIVAIIILKMVRDVGALWGFPRGQDPLAIAGNFFGTIGALAIAFMAWATIFGLGLFIPHVGKLATAAAFFTLTWAIGQVTKQFYASSIQTDRVALARVLGDLHVQPIEQSTATLPSEIDYVP